MGFDFSIQVRVLTVCQETGKAFVFQTTKDGFCKRYIQDVIVPEEHRPYTFLCGRLYHLYTREVSNADSHSCDIKELLDVFPSWEDLEDENLVIEWKWTQEDHNAFRAALDWFSQQKDVFYARWSY